MLRLLFKLALLITLVLTATGLTTRILGSTQPPNPALRGFISGCEGKPQPCWYSIVPGVTTIDKSLKRIESKGYKFTNISNDNLYFWDPSWRNIQFGACSNIITSFERESRIVSNITLIACNGITLGDLSLIGFPEKIMGNSDLYIKLTEYLAATVSNYERLDKGYFRKEWTPKTKVYRLDIGSSILAFSKAIDIAGAPWHGFVPHWRYCQLEPNYLDCQQ
jgi:hypothetical protein